MDNTREIDQLIKQSLDALNLHPDDLSGDLSDTWVYNIISLCEEYEQTEERIKYNNSILLQQRVLHLLPDSHRCRPCILLLLGISLFKRHERWSQRDDLDESVAVFCTALERLPEDHPLQSDLHSSLAKSFFTLYHYSGVEKFLHEAISHYNAALTLCAPDSTDRPLLLSNLALPMLERFDQKGLDEDLECALSVTKEALNLLPNGHPNRHVVLCYRAAALHAQFERTGRIKDLDGAIMAQSNALALQPKCRPDRFRVMGGLAGFLLLRFKETGQSDDLDEAVSVYHNRNALSIYPKAYADRFGLPRLLNNLADSLHSRYEQFGSEKDLDDAIHFNHEAVALCPKDHIHRPDFVDNLARCLLRRFEQRGCIKDADEAILLNRESLKVRLEQDDRLGRFIALNNLAVSLISRYEKHGLIEDIDEATSHFRSASTILHKGSSEDPVSRNNVALCLIKRYELSGRIEDLNEAILLYRESLALHREGHIEYSMTLNNLALSLLTRFDQTGRKEYLDEAISHYCKALAHCPEGRANRSMILDNLAMAHRIRFMHCGQTEDIDEAISQHRAALKLRPNGHPRRCLSLNNLAVALQTRYWCSLEGQEERQLLVLADEAILLLQEAVALRPDGHPYRPGELDNLARCFFTRFKKFGKTADLDKAISFAQDALDLRPKGHPERSVSLITLAESLYTRYKNEQEVCDLEKSMQLFELAATHKFSGTLLRLQAAHHWAYFAHMNDHHSTFKAYLEAISLLQLAMTISPTLDMQHEFLTADRTYPMLVLHAAAYAAEKGEFGKAVEFLEQGRALLWSQMRSFRHPLDRLAEVNKPLAEKFADVSRRLEILATAPSARSPGSEGVMIGTESNRALRPQHLADEMLKLRRQLSSEQEKLIGEIRQHPGFEDFLKAIPFETLKHAAKEGPVIIINICMYRSDALVILPSGDPPIVCIPLDETFYTNAQELYACLWGTRQECGASSSEYNEVLRQVMKILWDSVVSKIVQRLKELGFGEGTRIWWCTTWILSALPFHAAGPFEGPDGREKYLVDDYISSYTPTLGALIEARTESRKGKTKLLIVGDTSLASADREIETIRKYRMRTKELISNEATRDAVIESLRDTKWVHFTCHGHLDSKPLDSSFKLHDGQPSLLDIVKAHLPNAEFACLSACHTAEQSFGKTLDEVLHLAAAMQFCGFKSVIGSMWELYDPDGPHFARVIYEYMNTGPKGEAKYKRAARALREAVLKLKKRRDATTENWVNLIHIGA